MLLVGGLRRVLVGFGLFALCFGTVGCGGPTLSSSLETPFRVYETRDFRLTTDSPPEKALAVLEHMEKAHFVFEKIAYPYEPRFPFRTDVVLLAHEKSTDFLLTGSEGVFVDFAPEYLGAPTLYLGGDRPLDEVEETSVHEISHRFLHFHAPSAPRWLDEGLAQYYQTMMFGERNVVLGQSLLTKFQEKNKNAIVSFGLSPDDIESVSTLRKLTPEEFYDAKASAHYLSSWALIHALKKGPRRERFTEYLDTIQRAQVGEDVAFENTFGRESEATLYAEAKATIGSTLLEVERETVEVSWPPRAQATERELRPAEVRLLLAKTLLPKGKKEDVEAHLASAIELDPKNPEAYLLRGFEALRAGDFKRGLADFEHAYTLDKSPRYASAYLRALLELVFTRSDGKVVTNPEVELRKKTLASALLSQETTSENDVVLADYLLRLERVGNAEKYVLRAIEKDRANPGAYRILARVREAQGKLDQALEGIVFAVRLSPHGVVDPETTKLLVRYCDLTASRNIDCHAVRRAPPRVK